MVLLTLPWPPSLNRLYRAVGGRILLSAAARKYKKQLASALPSGLVSPLTGRLAVQMVLHAPAALGPLFDVANREKLCFDTLTEQRVWLDDSQIDWLLIERGAPSGKGHVTLTIREVDASPSNGILAT
jgi:crossover junction endodeoxyribonuclease RusA